MTDLPHRAAVVATEAPVWSAESLTRALQIQVAIGLGVIAALYHFVMIDRFVVLITVVVLTIALGDVDLRAVERSLVSRLSLVLGAYVFLYLWDLRLGVAASVGADYRREYYEIFAVCSYFVMLNALQSVRTIRPLLTFMLCFVGSSLVLEVGSYLANARVLSNPNLYSYLILAFVPFANMAMVRRPTAFGVLLAVLAAVTLFVFGSRSVTLALVLYGGVYYAWPWIAASKASFRLSWALFVASIAVFLYLYIFRSVLLEDNPLVRAGEELTSKSSFGRLEVWVDLVDRIAETPVWGHCSNCNTEFFPTQTGFRNLSSHNTYLEVVFRNGLVGLVLYLAFLAGLVGQFYRHKASRYAAIGAAYVFASMWITAVYEFIMFSFVSVNLLFWIAIGLLLSVVARTDATRPGIAQGSTASPA